MSEKRFIFNGIEIEDNKRGIEYNTFMKEGCEKIANQLNELVDENEELRQQMEIENKWQLEKDRYYVQLQEENEYLKKENARFKRMLENLGYKVVIIDE